jgi:hypothetical protein
MLADLRASEGGGRAFDGEDDIKRAYCARFYCEAGAAFRPWSRHYEAPLPNPSLKNVGLRWSHRRGTLCLQHETAFLLEATSCDLSEMTYLFAAGVFAQTSEE